MKRLLGVVVLAGALFATFFSLQSAKPGWWERLWYPLSYEQIVRGPARNYRLDPALLAAVIYQESKFKADAKSESGAIGLMQYLRHLLTKYGDEDDSLAAYNAGQDNVDRWLRAGKGIQFPETRAYVRRVEELKKIYRRAYGAELGA